MGAPMGQEHGFVVHVPYLNDEAEDDLVISASKDTLADIAHEERPERYFVALSYTGWNARQLEKKSIVTTGYSSLMIKRPDLISPLKAVGARQLSCSILISIS